MSLLSYEIDFRKFISETLHPRRRKPKRIALLMALAKRIREIHTEFIEVQIANKEKLKWVGQTILLERMLQLKFGSGIVIENLSSHGAVQIEFEADNQSNPITYIAPEFSNPISSEAGTGMLSTGFIIKVPASINFNSDEMKAVTNKYLINYKNYTIQIV